jgi:hypothetical protein
LKIKTNIRAGKGGASGTGQNGNSSTTPDPTQTADSSGPTNNTTGFYLPPTSRCPGF